MSSFPNRPLTIILISSICNLLFASAEASGDLVISEIMYNPGGLPEDVGAEYIELHNRSEAAVELQGYRLDKAVDFLFDGGRIPPGGHIVVASNISIFRARYPEVENVVGPWEGKLKNSGERIALFDGEGEQVDEVRFADEGDWATRSRGPDDRGLQACLCAV